MKLYINKGQYGWYTTAKNRNDKEDKAYVNLFFPKNTDPADGTGRWHKGNRCPRVATVLLQR